MEIIMTEIAQKKFEILEYTQSNQFTIDGLSNKLNELTKLNEEVNKKDLLPRVYWKNLFKQLLLINTIILKKIKRWK